MKRRIVNVKVNGVMTRDFFKNVKSYSLCSKCKNVMNCKMKNDILKESINKYQYITSGYETGLESHGTKENFVVTKWRKYR